MQISILASGSRGNCTLIYNEHTAILIDMGISTRKLKQSLAKIHLDINDLNAVFITHEHIDHIRGLKTFTKNYQIPIFSKTATLKQIITSQNFDKNQLTNCKALPNEKLSIQNLDILSFPISHDAIDPVGYNIFNKNSSNKINEKITLATDLGFVNETVKQALDASDKLIIEANHDINMLQNGQYPWSLKKRILSTKGHLSNIDAAFTISNLVHKPQEVILAHLSEQNNTPELAQKTVTSILNKQNLNHISVHIASSQEILSI